MFALQFITFMLRLNFDQWTNKYPWKILLGKYNVFDWVSLISTVIVYKNINGKFVQTKINDIHFINYKLKTEQSFI